MPDVPQRSQIDGAMSFQTGNRGDLDLSRNFATPARLTANEGIVLASLIDNSPVDSSQTNLGVMQYQSAGGNTWIAVAAAPENNGEQSVPTGVAFFP